MTNYSLRKFSFVFITLLLLAIQLKAVGGFTIYDLFKLKQSGDVVFSPDGKSAAYLLTVPRPFTDDPGSDYSILNLLDLSNNKVTVLIDGKINISSLHWNGSSEKIFFLSALDGEKSRGVYSYDLKTNDYTRLTASGIDVNLYKVSRDGIILAYSSVGIKEPSSKLVKMGFNQEIFEEKENHINLYLYNLKTKTTSQLTREISVFDFSLSNDSRKIAAAVAPENLTDHSYMFKRIIEIDVESGAVQQLVDNPGKLGEFIYSPDDKHLAFVSAADTNDSVAGSLFIAESGKFNKFKTLRSYSKEFLGSVTNIDWFDAVTVLFSAEEGVNTTLSKQIIGEVSREIIIKGDDHIFSGFSRYEENFIFSANTDKYPNEIHFYDGNVISRLTNHNEWLKNINLAKQVKIEYTAKDGLEIEAVLIYPLDYTEGQKYPLITYVHGGPESAELDGWRTSYSRWGQFAASAGYFVFMPNYRASAGRGYEFSLMGLGDLAGKEFDDILDGVDYLIDKGYIDKNRVGIGGGSYGGYFSAWAATKHSEKFAAAISFVGVSNQISKRYTTDIPWEDYYVHWGIWTHDNPLLIYDRSPVKYARNSKTPTLILHGTADPRVHPSQSLELYRSLKMHGKAPVRLVWYPGEGHGNRKNPARLDFALRTMAWFDYYLKGTNPENSMPESEITYDLKLLGID
ncbi:MAG: S9 family peptidase [Ignavibacteriales bacterium]|nr:S9 family peptidase [Ignavibacteriales bacterium]MCF8306564.1 S9 family peptidase [Ignavibacteriales bacterium]MCF8316363.1 S9 family peptidase [Ignavibacteriales bacterium]MCF8437679.1 S9 family peptidase [Ignavibacteriales bacterium]